MDKKLKKIWLKIYDMRNIEDVENYLIKKLGEGAFLIDDDGGIYVRVARRWWYLIFPQFWSPDKTIEDYIKPITSREFRESAEEYKSATRRHR